MRFIERIRHRQHDTGTPGGHQVDTSTFDDIWRRTTGDPIYGQPLALAARHADVGSERCAHCALPIRHIIDQGWVHLGERGTFGCRDTNRQGMFTGRYATPSPEPARVQDRPRSRSRAVGSYPPAAIEGFTLHGGDA